MLYPPLLIATNNLHKVIELRRLLKGLPYRIVAPQEMGLVLEVEEDGASYRENAALKARAFAQAAGMISLADDSGIEVEALGGRPGVLSARYGDSEAPEPQAADEGSPALYPGVRLLLQEMRDVLWEERACRYVSAIAVVQPEAKGSIQGVEIFEGACSGMVAWEPVGAHGFGYDPIFYSSAHGLTMAQMSPEMKDQFSHRGQAVRNAAELLSRLALASTSRPSRAVQ